MWIVFSTTMILYFPRFFYVFNETGKEEVASQRRSFDQLNRRISHELSQTKSIFPRSFSLHLGIIDSLQFENNVLRERISRVLAERESIRGQDIELTETKQVQWNAKPVESKVLCGQYKGSWLGIASAWLDCLMFS